MPMNERIVRTCGCEFRTSENNDERVIEGYFAVFNDNYNLGENWDGFAMTESIDRGAFDKYLGNDIRVLANHDTTLVLGRTKAGTATVTADGRGVYVRCVVNPEDADAMNVYARLKRGDVSQASFGGYIRDETREVNTVAKTVHYTLREIDVFEFSVCTFPAYEATEVGARGRENADLLRRWKTEMKERYKKWH